MLSVVVVHFTEVSFATMMDHSTVPYVCSFILYYIYYGLYLLWNRTRSTKKISDTVNIDKIK